MAQCGKDGRVEVGPIPYLATSTMCIVLIEPESVSEPLDVCTGAEVVEEMQHCGGSLPCQLISHLQTGHPRSGLIGRSHVEAAHALETGRIGPRQGRDHAEKDHIVGSWF